MQTSQQRWAGLLLALVLGTGVLRADAATFGPLAKIKADSQEARELAASGQWDAAEATFLKCAGLWAQIEKDRPREAKKNIELCLRRIVALERLRAAFLVGAPPPTGGSYRCNGETVFIEPMPLRTTVVPAR